MIHKGWKGLWIEGDRKCYEDLKSDLREYEIDNLTLEFGLVTAEKRESILDAKKIPSHFDLLSIDIDGNDFYIFQSLEKYKPRAIVIEYNATFGQRKDIVIDYGPYFEWNGTSYFGASLKALERMGVEKGYWLGAIFLEQMLSLLGMILLKKSF